MTRKKTTLQVAMIAALVLTSTGSWADRERNQGNKSADKLPSAVASTWFEQLYDVVREEKTAPPQASRIYGIAAVALYESVVAGTNDNRSLAGQLNGLTWVPRPQRNKRYHWPTVANAAFANTIRGLYPAMTQPSVDAIGSLEESFASQQQTVVSKRRYERSVAHGQAVATAILEWVARDGYSRYNNCPYVPARVPGVWEPTPPLANPNPLQPCWGLIRPMVLTTGDECRPPGYPHFSGDTTSAFHAASLEVYKTGTSLTDEQKTIADYWSDGAGATGTPPGHWIAIVSQIARNDDLSLAEAAEAYARVGIAVHDAFIVCWKSKYACNLQRPVTYINHYLSGIWMPYIATPNFPSYPSGHAMQSGAAARALTEMFGIKRFRDTTHGDHGRRQHEARTFRSFAEAADEAAASRLYGGIHYSFDNDDGLAAGQCIGQELQARVKFKAGHRSDRAHWPEKNDDEDNN